VSNYKSKSAKKMHEKKESKKEMMMEYGKKKTMSKMKRMGKKK